MTLRLSTTRTGIDVGDRARRELGALHRGRQRARQRHHDDAGGARRRAARGRRPRTARGRARRSRAAWLLLAQRAQNSARRQLARGRRTPRRRSGSMSGTMPMPCSSATASGRSQEESVTMRIAHGARQAAWARCGRSPVSPEMVHVGEATVARVGGDGRRVAADALADAVGVALAAAALEVGEPPRGEHEQRGRPSPPARGR